MTMRRTDRCPPCRAGAVAAAGLRALALLSTFALAACADLQPPRPWEKDVLAREAMRMDAPPLEARFERHLYTSKESASGGGSVGGGGCGCN